MPNWDMSWNTAHYTRAIADELRRTGEVRRSAARAALWRNRIHLTARRVGVRVTTRIEGDYIVGRLVEDT